MIYINLFPLKVYNNKIKKKKKKKPSTEEQANFELTWDISWVTRFKSLKITVSLKL